MHKISYTETQVFTQKRKNKIVTQKVISLG